MHKFIYFVKEKNLLNFIEYYYFILLNTFLSLKHQKSIKKTYTTTGLIWRYAKAAHAPQ